MNVNEAIKKTKTFDLFTKKIQLSQSSSSPVFVINSTIDITNLFLNYL